MQKNNYKLSKTLEGHSSNVDSVSFSPDSKHIISTSDNEIIKILSIKKEIVCKQLKEHKDFSISASFNPNDEKNNRHIF